ncbi:hypothetical protein CY659_11940 [Listeria monocytogenes serotype 4b]|uniref:hypothetical protein n=1 Tax=Listeria monocytogenes TaxID=1639 RepID=UPI000775722F|nr:hypothetical protein [Listeria monocytogenes]EAF4502342.1 hypothetical protein [Listeria monocytogenes serotype 4b]EAF4547117.1 hypothetical protein [Listeria monocytogenes serotype 1/2a]EHC6164968.1 hypothetical protein [Listeria monocytogenes serotype 1/2b]EAC5135305.1 hypothetical protein [Listeria monocytogenes]EAG2100229.1 hypothetical protein [Listeria monocytogenes]
MGGNPNARVLTTETVNFYNKYISQTMDDYFEFYSKVWKELKGIDQIIDESDIKGVFKVGYCPEGGSKFNNVADYGGELHNRFINYTARKDALTDKFKTAKEFYFFADKTLYSKFMERKNEFIKLNSLLGKYGSFLQGDRINSASYNSEMKTLRAEMYKISTVQEQVVRDIFDVYSNSMLGEGEIAKRIKDKYGNTVSKEQLDILIAYAQWIVLKQRSDGTWRSDESLLAKDAKVCLVRGEDGNLKLMPQDEVKDKGEIQFTIPGVNVSKVVTAGFDFGVDKKGNIVAPEDWKLPKKEVGFGAAVNFSALGVEFPNKYDESKQVQGFVGGEANIAHGRLGLTATNDGVNASANISAAEVSSTILDLHGRDTGFRVKVNLSVLTAGAEAKITMADGVSFKLGAGIIGAGFSAKTYDVIDERLRF